MPGRPNPRNNHSAIAAGEVHKRRKAKPQLLGAGNDGSSAGLFGFLQRAQVRFEGGAILALRFEVRLQFLHEQFETPDLVPEFLHVRGRWQMRRRSRVSL